jgi:hypothetical protein
MSTACGATQQPTAPLGAVGLFFCLLFFSPEKKSKWIPACAGMTGEVDRNDKKRKGMSTAHGETQQLTALKTLYAFSFAYFSFLLKRKVGGKSSPLEGKTFFEKKVSLKPFQKTFIACGGRAQLAGLPNSSPRRKAQLGFSFVLLFFSPEKKSKLCDVL